MEVWSITTITIRAAAIAAQLPMITTHTAHAGTMNNTNNMLLAVGGCTAIALYTKRKDLAMSIAQTEKFAKFVEMVFTEG